MKTTLFSPSPNENPSTDQKDLAWLISVSSELFNYHSFFMSYIFIFAGRQMHSPLLANAAWVVDILLFNSDVNMLQIVDALVPSWISLPLPLIPLRRYFLNPAVGIPDPLIPRNWRLCTRTIRVSKRAFWDFIHGLSSPGGNNWLIAPGGNNRSKPLFFRSDLGFQAPEFYRIGPMSLSP